MDSSIKISCTLIPQSGLNILIPNSAIEEVIKTPLFQGEDRTSSNILGYAVWKNEKVPVFTANPGLIPNQFRDSDQIILVIVKSPTTSTHMGFYASQSPRSTQANQRSLTDDPSPGYINSYASRYVSIDDQHAIIPNLDSCFSIENQMVN